MLYHCSLLNARSLVNKTHEFQQLLYCCSYDLILVTETWLWSEISSGLLDPKSRYYVLRQDRTDSHHGGGVVAFISQYLSVCQVPIDSQFVSLELLCFDVLVSKKTVRFFVVYRPPNGGGRSSADVVDNMRLLIACLKEYTAGIENSIIVGDFNLPKVNWQTNSSCGDNTARLFLDFVSTRGYYQLVSFPAREENVLDLILASDEQTVNSVLSRPLLGHSDHCVIDFNVVIKCIDSCEAQDAMPEVNNTLYNWYSGGL